MPKIAIERNKQDDIRRAAKKRQQQARKAKALADAAGRNHRAGFKFVRDDRLKEALERETARAEYERRQPALEFGQMVNEQIYEWLDAVDLFGVIVIKPDFMTTEAHFIMFKAKSELLQYLDKNTDKYVYERTSDRRVLIAKVKKS